MLQINFFSPIESLIQAIFVQYLANSYCLTIISENSLRNTFNVSFVYIHPNKIDGLFSNILEVSEMGCSDYIVDVSDPKLFLDDLEDLNHVGNTRRSDRKLIINFAHYVNQEELLKILNYKAIGFLANTILIIPKSIDIGGCKTYDLVTHQFVGVGDVNAPVYLDQWDSCTQNFKSNVNLFPYDMSNMLGRPLKVAAFTYKPYALLDLDRNIAPKGYDGTEMRIVDEFCRWVNCTIELVRDEAGQWGQIFDNRTGDGVLGNVAQDRADVGVTALYSWFHEYTFLDFSAAYIRTGITCITPAARSLPSWELPVLPFSLWMWVAVFCTLIYASVALIVVRGGSIGRSILTTFGMMITQTQSGVEGANWRVRSVTGWMLITGLVIDNAYGGGLASTLTVPKFEKSIDTIQDLVDSHLEWGATHDAWIFSITLSREPKIMSLVNKFRVYDHETLKRKSFTRSMGFSIERLPAGYFAIGEYITKEAVLDLEVMLEEFYWEQCVLVARKNSPYTAKVSDLVGRLHESGLLLAWETQVALKYLDFKVQLEVKLSRLRRNVLTAPLDIEHVVGTFILLGIGLTISFAVFIGEIFIYKSRNRQYNEIIIVF